MKKYCVHTDSDKYYYAIEKDNKLCLIQSSRIYNDNGMLLPLNEILSRLTGEWTLVGFRQILPFNNTDKLRSIEDIIAAAGSNVYSYMRFKNGNGRFTLVDYDHGSNRQWEDRINSVWEVNKF